MKVLAILYTACLFRLCLAVQQGTQAGRQTGPERSPQPLVAQGNQPNSGGRPQPGGQQVPQGSQQPVTQTAQNTQLVATPQGQPTVPAPPQNEVLQEEEVIQEEDLQQEEVIQEEDIIQEEDLPQDTSPPEATKPEPVAPSTTQPAVQVAQVQVQTRQPAAAPQVAQATPQKVQHAGPSGQQANQGSGPPGNVKPKADVTQAPPTPPGQGVGTHQPTVQAPVQAPAGQPAQSVSQTAARPGQQTHPENTKPVAGTPQGTPNGPSKPVQGHGSQQATPQGGAQKQVGQPAPQGQAAPSGHPVTPPQATPNVVSKVAPVQNAQPPAQQAVPNSPKPVQGHLPQNGQPPSTQEDPTTPPTKGVNVNLNSLDGTVLKVGYSTDRLLLLHTITPNDGHRLTEVTYLGASIWKSSDPKEHARTILVYYDGDFPVSLSVNIGQDNDLWKHHVKKGNKWIKVEEKGYKEALTNLRKLASSPKLETARLDVSSLDENLLTTTDVHDGDVPVKAVAVKSDYRLTKVFDLNIPIWKPKDERELCQRLWLYYDGERPVSLVLSSLTADLETPLKYFLKGGGTWAPVEKKDFDNALAETKRVSALLKLTPVKLNVASVDGTKFAVEDSKDGGVPLKTVTVKTGYRLVEIAEKGASLWKSSNEREHSPSILLYYDGDTPTLAAVNCLLRDGRKHKTYRYKDGTGQWNATEGDYKTRLVRLKEKVSPSTPVLLDLSSPDPSKIDVHEGVDNNGVSYKNYSVKNGYRITSVAESGVTVFGAVNEEEKYTSAEYYSRGGVTLLGLGINNDHSTKPKCFEKNGQEWSEISDDAFFDRYDVMLGESADNERDTWNESDDDSPEEPQVEEAPKVLTTSSPKPATPVNKDDVKPPTVTSQEYKDKLPLPPAFGTLAPGVRSGGFKG